MKTCTECEELKEDSQFRGKSSRCKTCVNRPYATKHYKINKPQIIKKVAKANKATIERNRTLVADYLSIHPCIVCSNANIVVLEFHHRDASLKKKAVSDMINMSYSEKAIFDEIAKCDVLCANCHREKTAEEQNNFKFKYSQH